VWQQQECLIKKMAMDLFFNPYLLILLICITYISFYGRDGFTNPISLFFIFIAFYIPIKYLLVTFLDLEFASSSKVEFGQDYQLFAIYNGGYLILIFLMLSCIFQFFFNAIHNKQKIIGVYIKTQTIIPSIILSGFIFLLFLLNNPFASLMDGLSFRHFTNTKGMSYLMIAFDTLSLCGVYQLLQARKPKKLTLFLLYLIFFYILNGRSGPVVMLGLFIFTYLYSVKKLVPIKSILIIGTALFIFALIHGSIRTEGNLISALTSLMEGNKNYDYYFVALIERISQVEEFSILAQLISDNKIESDFLSPLNLFIQFIPRVFWDTKPFFFNTQIMSIIYPEIFSAGVNFAFLGLGEFIYSFGLIIGIFLASIIMGYLLSLCARYLKFTKNNGEVFLFFYFIPYYYLMAGFNDGWMNTAVIPTILINIAIFAIIGRFIKLPIVNN